VLVVEGKDDFRVCVQLLARLGIETVQVMETGGFNRLASALKLYTKTPGWTSVERLAILVDCDDDLDARKQSVQGSLRQAGLAEPQEPGVFAGRDPAVAYCLIPETGGCLEDLIRTALSDGSALPNCVDTFLACSGLHEDQSSRQSKAWVHAYIAATEPGLKVGEAAKAGVLRLDDTPYDPIRTLLLTLQTGNAEVGP
jgi:hypothetical protein